jgi:N4-gp56 family major capsid protein
MQTAYGVNDPLAVKLWAKKLFVEAIQQCWFRNFISQEGNNVIQQLDDAEKGAGDTVNYGLRMQLIGAGVQGDGVLEGQEEALTTYADKVLIDQLRHAVNVGGRMTQQRVPFELREEGRLGLQDWWANRLDTAFFNHLCGNTVQANTAYTGNNATIAPSNIVLPTGVANESSLGSSNTFNLNLIDFAVEMAYTISPLIRPIKIEGEEKYVGFLHPFQVTDMRTSTSTGQWLDIEKAAATGGEVSNNPIYTGALGEYNGCVLHKAYRVTPCIATGAYLANTARAVVCGAQSGALAFGRGDSKETFDWVEELFDYGNMLGIAAGSIFGIKKAVFNSKDFGVINVSTYATFHASSAEVPPQYGIGTV